MALDKVLKIYDENGNPVDYDILASDVKLSPDGKDLPTKLAEMQDDIDHAGQGDGTVTGVKVGNTPYSPDSNGVVDLSTPFAGKVDKEIGKSLMTDAERTKLQNLPTADQLTQQLDQKANNNAVVKSISVNGTAQTKDGNGNVNVVVPTLTLDDAPTAGSNNAVKSGGVKTALDAKANAADVPTKTEMSDAIDDALGEAQVTVVPEGSVGVISSLGSDSDEDALSASMGKKLKVAIITILNSLGNYAFPDGKPVIDWGDDSPVTFTVSKTIGTGLSATGGDTDVAFGDSLEVTIDITNNLYVVDDNSVVVTMGGQPVAGAWNASTMKVTIGTVTGNVVINVPSLTYVQRGLVLHLDGKNGRSVAHRWDSLVNYNNNPLYFKLENCDEQSDYVAGNGTSSKGTAFSDSALTTPVTLLDVGATEGTIEAAYSHAEIASNGNLPIMHNALGSGNRICLTSWHAGVAGADENVLTFCTAPAPEFSGNVAATLTKSKIQNGGLVSCKLDSVLFNGVSEANLSQTNQSTTEESRLSIFYRRTSNDQFSKYRLYALRVYSVQLTDVERAQNLAIDQKRFNLS